METQKETRSGIPKVIPKHSVINSDFRLVIRYDFRLVIHSEIRLLMVINSEIPMEIPKLMDLAKETQMETHLAIRSEIQKHSDSG